MEEYLAIEIVKGRLYIKKLREITVEDFAPVALAEGGAALSFICLIADDTAWMYNQGELKHTGSLKIAFKYAPQIKAKIDALKQEGFKADQLTLVYLMDLFKVYESYLEKEVKGKTEKAKTKALEELKTESTQEEKTLYKQAVDSFNKAINMLDEM